MATTIRLRSVRTLAALEPLLAQRAKFRFAIPVADIGDAIKQNVGLPEPLKPGMSFLPGICGSKSDTNANGRIVVRKDLPMEQVPRAIYRTWNDWHGQPHSGLQFRHYPRYPRQNVPPQEEYFFTMLIDGKLCVCSDLLTYGRTEDERIMWCFNLFLECFGQCFCVGEDNKGIEKPRFKRFNWELLPKGDYPWAKLSQIITQRLAKRGKPEGLEVTLERLKYLRELGSSDVGFGRGGFDGYIVLEYERAGLWVLESSYLDNATYVFDSEWDVFSSLTKNEILSGKLCKRRVIHDKKWKSTMRSLVAPPSRSSFW